MSTHPRKVIESFRRSDRNEWTAHFLCDCGVRHTHGAYVADDGRPTGGRSHKAAHCQPLANAGSLFRCPCGLERRLPVLEASPVHAAHIAASKRNRATGYVLIDPAPASAGSAEKGTTT